MTSTEWKQLWHRAAAHFGVLCAMSLYDSDLEDARKYARLYHLASERAWKAWTREQVEKQRRATVQGIVRAVDWFGEN